MHAYRATIYLGDCALPPAFVNKILTALKAEWWGPKYKVLSHNCCNFSREFAVALGVGNVPAWIDRLATRTASDDAIRYIRGHVRQLEC